MCGTAIVKNARDCPASRLETKAIPGVFVFFSRDQLEAGTITRASPWCTVMEHSPFSATLLMPIGSLEAEENRSW